MENSNVSKIVIGFFMIIVGLALIVSVANSSAAVTLKTNIVNEAVDITTARLSTGCINESTVFTVTNYPSGWKVNDCPLTSFVYGNSSTDYTLTTDYIPTLSAGTFTLVNTSTVVDGTNATLVDYTYCQDGYMNLAWGRSILNLVAGFFALAILGLGLGMFYSVAKDAGIIGK